MKNSYLLCIAHRGAMGHEPENTLASVRKALALGALCIEVDTYYVDKRLVIFHDDRLERTTNGTGYIYEQSFDYLRKLDAGNGQQIPTLEEVSAMINAQTCLNIELKGENTAEPVAELLADMIDNGWDKASFLVSSFRHHELLKIKKLVPDINIGALIHGLPVDNAKFAKDLDAFSVHPSLECIDQRFIDDAHARCLRVYVYGVNHVEDIARMQKIGADGVFTNFPERVLKNYSQGDFTTKWCDR
ncbi:MAG: glycerophosphodiester phosphodiesterase [Gammaproteobacteria bacterium]|nr:MAG: glycerophosphodiester phosphodiesterase [Gammaproteobacteria bacterium]